MKKHVFGKLLFWLYLVLFAGVAISFLVFFGQTRRELSTLRAREAEYTVRLERAERELQEQQEYYHRLLHDPDFVERVARERLGYAKPGEWIFRFEDNE